MRLNRYIASCTEYSRRQADRLIEQGRIKINGKVVKDFSQSFSAGDIVYLDNKILRPKKLVYYIVNKPAGVVVSRRDEHAKKLITDLVPPQPPVFPVGRLDKNSTGLILMTNDGEIAQELMHPKYGHEKEYLVVLKEELSDKQLVSLKQGIVLSEGLAVFDKIKFIKAKQYKVVIHQGWNRQIRRMFQAVGNEVVQLKRVRLAGLSLGGLPEGKYIKITKNKLMSLINKK